MGAMSPVTPRPTQPSSPDLLDTLFDCAMNAHPELSNPGGTRRFRPGESAALRPGRYGPRSVDGGPCRGPGICRRRGTLGVRARASSIGRGARVSMRRCGWTCQFCSNRTVDASDSAHSIGARRPCRTRCARHRPERPAAVLQAFDLVENPDHRVEPRAKRLRPSMPPPLSLRDSPTSSSRGQRRLPGSAPGSYSRSSGARASDDVVARVASDVDQRRAARAATSVARVDTSFTARTATLASSMAPRTSPRASFRRARVWADRASPYTLPSSSRSAPQRGQSHAGSTTRRRQAGQRSRAGDMGVIRRGRRARRRARR